MIELFFFAYRDFVGDADRLLEKYKFGRAHHRVLHFVDRRPGLAIAALLDILKITKQSLNRVLKQLLDGGFVEARAGANDRRQRLLYTTPKGAALARELARLQSDRFVRVLGELPPDARRSATEFLLAMIDEDDRDSVGAHLLVPRDGAPGRRGDAAVTHPAAPEADAAHILVVDDDKRIRTLLSRFLIGEGYRVSAAASAHEATARLRDLLFDFIVLDVMMPGESGVQFAREAARRRLAAPRRANIDADRLVGNQEPRRGAGGRRRRLSRQAVRAARTRAAHRQHTAAHARRRHASPRRPVALWRFSRSMSKRACSRATTSRSI